MNAIEQIRQKVKTNTLPSVIAMGGTELAFIEQAIELIRLSILEPSSKDFNFEQFSIGENELLQVIQSLNTLPFLANKRLVELRRLEKLSSDDDDLELLIKYLENPNEKSVLVLFFDKIDKRNKLVNWLIKKNYLYVFEPANKADINSYTLSLAQKLNISFAQGAMDFLIDTADHDLLLLNVYMEKLALLFEAKQVNIDDIALHLIDMAEHDVFLLARAISEGDLPKSLFLLAQVRATGENALKLLGVLAWQFRTIVQCRHLVEQGLSDSEIQQKISVFGDRFFWMAKVAKQNKVSFHINRLTKLLSIDQSLKSFNNEPFNYLEKVVYQSAVGNLKTPL